MYQKMFDKQLVLNMMHKSLRKKKIKMIEKMIKLTLKNLSRNHESTERSNST